MTDLITNIKFIMARTGKLRQHYTLFEFRKMILPGFWAHISQNFKQNLGYDFEIAKAKAKQIAGKYELIFFESKQNEYHQIEAFGLEWKRTTKGYIAIPDEKFWTEWKSRKQEIKNAGFRVFKNNYTQEFNVFLKLQNT